MLKLSKLLPNTPQGHPLNPKPTSLGDDILLPLDSQEAVSIIGKLVTEGHRANALTASFLDAQGGPNACSDDLTLIFRHGVEDRTYHLRGRIMAVADAISGNNGGTLLADGLLDELRVS